MQMGCAECGCIIESGRRVVVCTDNCCCQDIPVKSGETPSEIDDDGS